MSRSKRNKNKAVALKYNAEQDAAPVVIASGYGSIAEKIIDIAEEKGIPVFRDDSAASLLCMLEVGSNIPPELYEIIASIYCQLLKTSMEIKNRVAKPSGSDKMSLDEKLNRLARRTSPTQSKKTSTKPQEKVAEVEMERKSEPDS